MSYETMESCVPVTNNWNKPNVHDYTYNTQKNDDKNSVLDGIEPHAIYLYKKLQ